MELCCPSQLSVTVHNSGGSSGGRARRRAGCAFEEVVVLEFDVLRELQLRLGLLDVAVDRRDQGFCRDAGKSGAERARITDGICNGETENESAMNPTRG